MAFGADLDLKIDTDLYSRGVKSLEKKLLNVAEEQVPLAMASAINRVGSSVRGKLAKDLAKEAGVKPGVVRARIKFFKAHRRKLLGRMWVGLQPIPAHRLGRAKQLPYRTNRKRAAGGRRAKGPSGFSGVIVGGREFEGAFLATIAGKDRVVKRKGRARLPIEVQKIPLSPALGRISRGFMSDATDKLLERYAHELRQRLRRKGFNA